MFFSLFSFYSYIDKHFCMKFSLWGKTYKFSPFFYTLCFFLQIFVLLLLFLFILNICSNHLNLWDLNLLFLPPYSTSLLQFLVHITIFSVYPVFCGHTFSKSPHFYCDFSFFCCSHYRPMQVFALSTSWPFLFSCNLSIVFHFIHAAVSTLLLLSEFLLHRPVVNKILTF